MRICFIAPFLASLSGASSAENLKELVERQGSPVGVEAVASISTDDVESAETFKQRCLSMVWEAVGSLGYRRGFGIQRHKAIQHELRKSLNLEYNRIKQSGTVQHLDRAFVEVVQTVKKHFEDLLISEEMHSVVKKYQKFVSSVTDIEAFDRQLVEAVRAVVAQDYFMGPSDIAALANIRKTRIQQKSRS